MKDTPDNGGDNDNDAMSREKLVNHVVSLPKEDLRRLLFDLIEDEQVEQVLQDLIDDLPPPQNSSSNGKVYISDSLANLSNPLQDLRISRANSKSSVPTFQRTTPPMFPNHSRSGLFRLPPKLIFGLFGFGHNQRNRPLDNSTSENHRVDDQFILAGTRNRGG